MDSVANTLRASYKAGYKLYSQFVPLPLPLPLPAPVLPEATGAKEGGEPAAATEAAAKDEVRMHRFLYYRHLLAYLVLHTYLHTYLYTCGTHNIYERTSLGVTIYGRELAVFADTPAPARSSILHTPRVRAHTRLP